MSKQTQTNFFSGLIKVFDYDPDPLYTFACLLPRVIPTFRTEFTGSQFEVLVPQKFIFWRESLKMVNFLVPLQIRMKHRENIFKMAT